MKGDARKVAQATEMLNSIVTDFIDRAKAGDVKGMLERGVLVDEAMRKVAEAVTGTGIPS